MKTGTIFFILGRLLILLSSTLLLPIPVSLYYHDGMWNFFLLSATTALAIGLGLSEAIRTDGEIGHKEGFAIVTFGWLATALLGTLPYYWSGGIPSFIDAFFESMSGFTTTGSSILKDVEALAPSLLFWRCLTHWIGGMGIIVLSLAILPMLRVGGMQLFFAEVPGPTKEKLTPRVQDTARIFGMIYLMLTAVETALLMFAGMNFFDAVCHAFSTIATGGFSTRTASVAAFQSPLIDAIITIFMIISSINFVLHYHLLKGNRKKVFQSEELRFYLAMGFGATLIVFFSNIWSGVYSSWGDSLRYSSFQVWSIISTTGFGTADYDHWLPVVRLIMPILMLTGGMVGSTSGAIKQMRIVILLKTIRVQITKILHRHAVPALKLDGRVVSRDVVQAVLGFLALYLAFASMAVLIVTGLGVDMVTGVSAVITTMGGVGPGLGEVGPAGNFADLPRMAKVVLSVCMLAGRLELYTLIVLFLPDFWKGVRAPQLWMERK